jgi:hypothetical protein
MQPALAPITKQKRLRKFIRQPDQLADRQITDKGLAAIAVIDRYRFSPSSLLTRLMPGNQRNNYQNLQTLFHKGLIQRFALPKFGGPGEFIYYLDDKKSLELAIDAGVMEPLEEGDWKRRKQILDTNREKNYNQLHRDPDVQGKLLFIQHELGVSRFHAMLELACSNPKLAGRVELVQWTQGPQLNNKVAALKVRPRGRHETTGRTMWEELATEEHLAHRPDAFFTLRFPTKPEGKQESHFLYEHDRATENTTRFKMKLRAHHHFIVQHHRQRQAPYNVHAIRAVLIETTEPHWKDKLREAARENVVSPNPSPLFWYTTSTTFTERKTITTGNKQTQLPRYLLEPECIFQRIWQSPTDDKLLNLAD